MISVSANNDCGSSNNTDVIVLKSYFRSCLEILTANPSSIDSVYTIDPDGSGTNFSPMQCQCDMTTDGGGWTLVANYLRQGGVTGVPVGRTYLPLIASSILGVHESSNLTAWGHGNILLMNALPFTEIRYYAETSRHTRIMHYRNADGVSYFKTGIGTFTMSLGYTFLPGHTANLPAFTALGVGMSGGSSAQQLDNDLWVGGVYMTTTGTPGCGNPNARNFILGSAGGAVWEVDNYGFSGCPGYTTSSVVFRSWIR